MDKFDVLREQLISCESGESAKRIAASFDAIVETARNIKEEYKSCDNIVEKEALMAVYTAIEKHFEASAGLMFATNWLIMVRENQLGKGFEG